MAVVSRKNINNSWDKIQAARLTARRQRREKLDASLEYKENAVLNRKNCFPKLHLDVQVTTPGKELTKEGISMGECTMERIK